MWFWFWNLIDGWIVGAHFRVSFKAETESRYRKEADIGPGREEPDIGRR